MGKIRVKTLGDEDQEKKDQKKTEARAEAKKAAQKKGLEDAGLAAEIDESPIEKKKMQKKQSLKREQSHSATYIAHVAKIEKDKKYKLNDALAILPTIQSGIFDETVELHINTTEKGISGNVILPHGTGKETRIAIANQTTDSKGVEDLVKKIEAGHIDFDVLIATPDAMPKLARVARTLGPRGLMPNPKNGTVSPKPEEVAKKFQGGQVNFKTESKFPLIHLVVGKVSFGDKKLAENTNAMIKEIKTKNIKSVTLKSTMSPGIKLEVASL